jgi:hypothetical protein
MPDRAELIGGSNGTNYRNGLAYYGKLSVGEVGLLMAITEAHRAAIVAARLRRAEQERENARVREAEFNAWSERHAKVWAAWKMHCGRAQHDCDYCKDYRSVTSGIPKWL